MMLWSTAHFGQMSSGIISVARLRTRKNPATSVIVVSSGPDATAGSWLNRLRSKGTTPPTDTAISVLMASATPMTTPRNGFPFQSQATKPIRIPRTTPVDHADHNLLRPDPEYVDRLCETERKFTQRDRHGLIARATTHVRYHRQEDCDGDDGGKRLLVKRDDASCDDVEDDVAAEPGETPARSQKKGHRAQFVAEDALAPEALAFGPFEQGVRNSRARNGADQPPEVIGDRQPEELVLAEQVLQLFERRAGADGYRRDHNSGEWRRAFRGKEVAERHDADQPVRFVDDIGMLAAIALEVLVLAG